MKNFFILLMVVLMLAGLTFGSFAKQSCNGNAYTYDPQGDFRVRDGSYQECPNPDGCVPIGGEHKWGGQKE